MSNDIIISKENFIRIGIILDKKLLYEPFIESRMIPVKIMIIILKKWWAYIFILNIREENKQINKISNIHKLMWTSLQYLFDKIVSIKSKNAVNKKNFYLNFFLLSFQKV